MPGQIHSICYISPFRACYVGVCRVEFLFVYSVFLSDI